MWKCGSAIIDKIVMEIKYREAEMHLEIRRTIVAEIELGIEMRNGKGCRNGDEN